MKEIRGLPAAIRSRRHVDSLRQNHKTLRQHYEEKRKRYRVDVTQFYDMELRRLFSNDPKFANRESAASFLERMRPQVAHLLANWTGHYQYTINQMLGEVIERCRKLKLRLPKPERAVMRDALVMLTVQTMNYIHNGHHRLAL
jgi:hypothetical protein